MTLNTWLSVGHLRLERSDKKETKTDNIEVITLVKRSSTDSMQSH